MFTRAVYADKKILEVEHLRQNLQRKILHQNLISNEHYRQPDGLSN